MLEDFKLYWTKKKKHAQEGCVFGSSKGLQCMPCIVLYDRCRPPTLKTRYALAQLLNLHLDDRVQALVMESAPEATNLLHFLNVWNAIDEALASHIFRQVRDSLQDLQ